MPRRPTPKIPETNHPKQQKLLASRNQLADRHHFVLDHEQWTVFQAALNRPATDKPRLKKLLMEPSVTDGY
ncbi:MAG: DUF1778 domain-containing protein [Lautropia sp.]|nr:DUF1778 domain-containing protein [Lautropia sp.]